MNASNIHQVISLLRDQEYENLRVIEGTVIGTLRYFATSAIVVGITEESYERRYCYASNEEAVTALALWNGREHPGGDWIKLKGCWHGAPVDMLNPGLK